MSDTTNASSTEQSEGVAAVGMLLAAYVDELAAEQVLEQMKQAKKSGELYYEDAAVIRQDPKGKVHIKETGDMSSGKGAGVGALIGGLIGLLGGPAGVALGAGGGAAIGAMAAHHDAGFSHESLKEIGGALLPGTSALAATTSQAFVEAVRKQAPQADSLSLARELATAIHDRLQARQDTLFGLLITEHGIAATEIVSSPSELAVFGIAVTEDATVVSEAVATDEGVVAASATAVAGSEEGEAEEDESDTPA
jgi:uncharacterized membrane protein